MGKRSRVRRGGGRLRRTALRVAAALLVSYCALGVAPAQTPGRYGYKQPLASAQLNTDLGTKADTVNPVTGSPLVPALTRVQDASPVNGDANPGLASTYFGLRTFPNRGAIRTEGGHAFFSGYTNGWADGTCVMAVLGNAAKNAGGCGQGGFWDMGYRVNYPGQDADAAIFNMQGAPVVAKTVPVVSVGSEPILNLAGAAQTVGTVHLSTALNPAQIAAILQAPNPFRVQLSNGYFGYLVPPGLTTPAGVAAPPVSADGLTVLVDNFTRSIVPGNATAPDTAGGVAASPTLPYVTAGTTLRAGTGINPMMVGMTNGSAALPSYTVTIGGNLLSDTLYLNTSTDDTDTVNDARIIEMGSGISKSGTSTWDELHPLNDLLNGVSFLSHQIYASCSGTKACGAWAYVGAQIKRGLVCENPQANTDEGGTECILDVASVFGYKSTKSSGYVLWIDPGATGAARAVVDWNGNVSTKGQVYVGDGSGGVTISPTGNVIATGSLNASGWSIKNAAGVQTGYADGPTGNLVVTGGLAPGQYTVSQEPGCNAAYLGLQVYLVDARKPGEPAGGGSGSLAVCSPPSLGAAPAWLSIFDHAVALH